MTKFNYIFRHFFLLALFMFFAKHAIERSFEHIKQEKPSPWEAFEVHDLDKNFLCAIKETRKQVSYLLSIFAQKDQKDPKIQTNNTDQKLPENKNIANLETMLKELDTIEQKYTKNSPATFLLGPIGTTAIVLKEQRLERHLLGIITDVKNILHVLHNKETQESIKVASVQAGIIGNHKLISKIT